jgi:hypothetical protein
VCVGGGGGSLLWRTIVWVCMGGERRGVRITRSMAVAVLLLVVSVRFCGGSGDMRGSLAGMPLACMVLLGDGARSAELSFLLTWPATLQPAISPPTQPPARPPLPPALPCPPAENCSLLWLPPWSNPWLLAAISVSMLLHMIILYTPPLAAMFR